MELTIHSSARVNSLFWIKSLETDEEGSTRRVLDDLEPFLASQGIPFEVVTPRSATELLAALTEIERLAKAGAKPLIHVDTHGNPNDGIYLVPSDEFVGWDVFADSLRCINVATGNNLCVVSAACFGFYMTKHNSIHQPAPFYLLIGPSDTVTFGFAEQNLFAFYRAVFQQLDLLESYEKHLAGRMDLFHSEKLLVVGMARYFRFHCMGKGARKRIDDLVNEAIKAGAPNDPDSLRIMRRTAKDNIKPTAELFDRYASSYLIGRPPGVTFEQVMKFVRAEACDS